MKFEVQQIPIQNGDMQEHAVMAISPRYGNDTALIAVFNHPGAAAELAAILTVAAQQLEDMKGLYAQYPTFAPQD